LENNSELITLNFLFLSALQASRESKEKREKRKDQEIENCILQLKTAYL